MTGVSKAMVCDILSIERVAHVVAAAGFLSRYMNGSLPYV